jgi:hypothetical protein
MGETHPLPQISAAKFLDAIFEGALSDPTEFDPDVVELVRKHVGQASLHSRAGYNLAEAIGALALQRVERREP